MILKETEYYRISIDPNVPCLEWIGLKPMNSEIFRESEIILRDSYLAKLKSYKSLCLYVDARKIGLLSTVDTTWVAKEILSPMASAGLKKEAFVIPESALERLIVSNFINKAGDEVELKKFSDEKTAKEYLRQ
jgi:hypothetical protein